MSYEQALYDDVKEVKDRMRRMETRLTRYLESVGFDSKTKKPVWSNGQVALPSIQCSLSDILMAIPNSYGGNVSVFHGEELVMVLQKPIR